MYCKFKNVWNTVTTFALYVIVKFARLMSDVSELLNAEVKKMLQTPAFFFVIPIV